MEKAALRAAMMSDVKRVNSKEEQKKNLCQILAGQDRKQEAETAARKVQVG